MKVTNTRTVLLLTVYCTILHSPDVMQAKVCLFSIYSSTALRRNFRRQCNLWRLLTFSLTLKGGHCGQRLHSFRKDFHVGVGASVMEMRMYPCQQFMQVGLFTCFVTSPNPKRYKKWRNQADPTVVITALPRTVEVVAIAWVLVIYLSSAHVQPASSQKNTRLSPKCDRYSLTKVGSQYPPRQA